MMGSERICKELWYKRGGFSNPRCWRRQQRSGGWQYWYRHD